MSCKKIVDPSTIGVYTIRYSGRRDKGVSEWGVHFGGSAAGWDFVTKIIAIGSG